MLQWYSAAFLAVIAANGLGVLLAFVGCSKQPKP